jgi:hypothetical protein
VSGHQCLRPGCEVYVPPRMLACKPHWQELPTDLRRAVWAHYREGQEHSGDPSPEYLEALHAVVNWWEEHGAETPPEPPE